MDKQFFSDVLENLERKPALKSVANFSDELASFKARLNDNFFRLAVVGEFSSGKSTFINALVGKDILSHATKETTAVLTELINVADNDPRNGSAIAQLCTGQSVTIRNLDELKDYTTAVSTKYHVAKEIVGVKIFLPLKYGTRPLMIMDTPGLNGIAEGHLEQTKSIVKRAHACIYLIQQRGLTKDDLEFLKNHLVPLRQRFIFVQNFIDEFNSDDDETVADRINSLRKILTEQVFDGTLEQEFFICGVSALKELAVHDTAIKKLYATDTENLSETDRKRLAVESNFAEFRKILSTEFSDERLNEIQFGGTARAIQNWLQRLLETVNRRLAEDVEIFNTSREKNAAERIERLMKKIRDRRQSNLTAIRSFIDGEIKKLNRELDGLIENGGNEIEQRIIQDLNSCTRVEELETKRANLSQKISREFSRLSSDGVEYSKISFQNLYQLVMERIEEYSGIRSVTAGENFRVDATPSVQRNFQSETELERHERELRQIKSALESERKTFQNENANVRNAENKFSGVSYEVNDAQRRINQKQNEIRRMGSRPAERVWYEDVPVERGGFFGAFVPLGAFFITKTESQEFRDDSAGETWDSQRRQLQAQQNSLLQQLNETLRRKEAAERDLRRYKASAQASADRTNDKEQRIRRLEELLKSDRDQIETEKRRAREEFIRVCKNQLRERVQKYFHGDAFNDGEIRKLADELKRQTTNGGNKLFAEAKREFDRNIEKKLSQLEQSRQGNLAPVQKKISGLEQTKRNLELLITRTEGKFS